MAFLLADRVRETSTTTGAGASYALAGAVSGFRSFSAIGTGNVTCYVALMSSQWEIGIGTVAASSISRDTILASSSAGAKVNWGSGTKEVRCDLPAEFISNIARFSVRSAISASGTTMEFTGISPYASKLTLTLENIGTTGDGLAGEPRLQIGSAAGYASTDYRHSVAAIDSSTNVFSQAPSVNEWKLVPGSGWSGGVSKLWGTIDLTVINTATNLWAMRSTLVGVGGYITFAAGTKDLSGSLDRIRLFTNSGTATISGIIGLLEQ